MDIMRDRIAELMKERQIAGSRLSSEAGADRSFISDFIIGKKKTIRADTLARIARILNADVAYFFGEQDEPKVKQRASGLTLHGFVEAGMWQEADLVHQDWGEPSLLMPDPRFPVDRQFVLGVRGDSMDEVAPPGSQVLAVDWPYAGRPLANGQIVVARRERDQLCEFTLKEVQQTGDQITLCPRSSNPKHRPFVMDDSTTITGLVLRKAEALF